MKTYYIRREDAPRAKTLVDEFRFDVPRRNAQRQLRSAERRAASQAGLPLQVRSTQTTEWLWAQIMEKLV